MLKKFRAKMAQPLEKIGPYAYAHTGTCTDISVIEALLKVTVETANMFVQIAAVHKPFLAMPTEVWPIVHMNPHVSSQLRAIGERLAALRAEVRPFSAMFCHVQSKLACPVPDLATDGAAERPVIGVM